MTHQQILDKLASKYLVKSIDENVARLVFKAKCGTKNGWIDDELSYILENLLLRWNCVLNDTTISLNYKHITNIALATILHKYGYSDTSIIEKAIKAIDALNEAVVLDDDFFHKSKKIKDFLLTQPNEMKRKPSIAENITFYRAEDVISICIENRYYAGYVHEITGCNESPVIELYEKQFNLKPSIKELLSLKAKGQVFDDLMMVVTVFLFPRFLE